MTNTDVARQNEPGMKRMTHDRSTSADVGYQVWTPFEAELRGEAGGNPDEVAKRFIHAFNVFER
jgi:hypothetical protein